MTEDGKKYDAMIKACNISKEELIEAGQMKGLMGVYNLGLENMYDYLIKNLEVRKHGSWFLLDECANEGVYCSVCNKKVYKLNYANQKLKSKYCPNCGAIMDGKETTKTDKNDDRPQCCIDHVKYFSTCDTCEFGE